MINYYGKKYPEKQDVIVVKILKISDEKGLYAKSIEYPELSIYVLPTEISRRKVNLKKMFSPDKYYSVVVLNVNRKNNQADVSYMKISEKERNERIERFQYYEKIHKIGSDITEFYASYMGKDEDKIIHDIYESVIWPIMDKLSENYHNMTINSTKDYYTSILMNPETLFSNNNKFSEEFIKNYSSEIRKKIKVSDMKISSEIKLVVMQSDAVGKLVRILTENIESDVEIQYIASPRYKIVVTGTDKETAEKKMETVINTIKHNCIKYGGSFVGQDPILVQKDKTYNLH